MLGAMTETERLTDLDLTLAATEAVVAGVHGIWPGPPGSGRSSRMT
jgi:hypothetical protein